MKRNLRLALGLLALATTGLFLLEGPELSGNQGFSAVPAIPDDGKLRIIGFGAHPDDNEFRAGGVAAL